MNIDQRFGKPIGSHMKRPIVSKRRGRLGSYFLGVLALAGMLTLAACGSGGGGGAPAASADIASIQISPSLVIVPIGSGQWLSATVSDTAGNAVDGVDLNWSVEGGTDNGTVTASGYYRTPPSLPVENTITVKAMVPSNPGIVANVSILLISGLTPEFSNNVEMTSAKPDASTASSGQRSVAVLGKQVFVAWSDNLDRGTGISGYNVYTAASNDRGQIFGPEFQVNQSIDPILPPRACSESTSPRPCQPSLAVDWSGNIYLAWEDFRNDNFDIFFSKCRFDPDQGIQCGENIQVNPIGLNDQTLPTIAVDASGDHLYVAWWNNQLNQIQMALSTDGGGSFTPPMTVSDPTATSVSRSHPGLDLGPAGDPHLVWRNLQSQKAEFIIYASSSDKGGTISTRSTVSDGPTIEGRNAPVLAVDQTGEIYVVWQDFRATIPEIRMAKSIDGGKAFLPSIQVNDTLRTVGKKQPTLALDPYGNLLVAWAEDDGVGSSDIYFAKSMNGGSSFGPNIQVTQTSIGSKSHPTLAADDAGRAYLFWTDSRTGEPRLFFSRGE